MSVKFGPAGNSESFYEQGGKSSLEMPKWLCAMGLDAYEYQCGRGVKISDDSAIKLGGEAGLNNIALSIHSPYYVNIATDDAEKQQKSIGYIMQTARAAHYMGAGRVVVHMGANGKNTRRQGIEISKDIIKQTLTLMRDAGYNAALCLETMGKKNQLGTVSETVEVCGIDDTLLPALDFGHINARGEGCIKGIEDYRQILDEVENALGFDRLARVHIHFNKIEYTHMGERKHLTMADTVYGPEFEPLAELIYKRNLEPVIICESDGVMAEDAKKLKEIYSLL